MTPFADLMEATQRTLRERRHDARNAHEIIFVSKLFLDEFQATPPAELPTHQFTNLIEQLRGGHSITMRGIPIYLDERLQQGFVILKGNEASDFMKFIHKRNEARRPFP